LFEYQQYESGEPLGAPPEVWDAKAGNETGDISVLNLQEPNRLGKSCGIEAVHSGQGSGSVDRAKNSRVDGVDVVVVRLHPDLSWIEPGPGYDSFYQPEVIIPWMWEGDDGSWVRVD
jgi:hypothetical protein